MTHPTARLLAVALLASTALVACKKNDDAAMPASTAPTPASDTTLPAAAPAPMPSTPATPATSTAVSDVQLGSAVGADNRVTTPMTSFGTKDTLYASVTTAANASGTLGARWSYLGADGNAAPTVVDTQMQDLGGAAGTHEFHVSKPDGWPAGKYRVEITHDGNVVQTRDFDVR